jgi:hypothetical protein
LWLPKTKIRGHRDADPAPSQYAIQPCYEQRYGFQRQQPVAPPYLQSLYVRFSNRPFGVKHFQTIHLCGFDVARGLALLFGIGTKALPSWDSKMRWNNL